MFRAVYRYRSVLARELRALVLNEVINRTLGFPWRREICKLLLQEHTSSCTSYRNNSHRTHSAAFISTQLHYDRTGMMLPQMRTTVPYSMLS